MNKYLKNNQGYTLVIVLVVLVLFTVIGASLMTLNFNNTLKNASREDNTQAQDLSIKGIDYVVRELENEVKKLASPTNGLTPQQFNTQFTALLNSYTCSEVLQKSLPNTTTGTATYCINDFKDSSPETPNLKEVTFKSVGQSDNKQFETNATYLLGSSITENFGYALLTYGNSSPNPNQTNTTGNIEIHGGVQIKGNIFSDNTLITSNSSRYKKTIVPSVSPIILGTNPTADNKLIDARIEQRAAGIVKKLAVPNDKKLENDLEAIGDPNYKHPSKINWNNAEDTKKTIKYNEYHDGSKIIELTPIKADVNHNRVNFDIDSRIRNKRNEFYENNTDKIRNDVAPIQTKGPFFNLLEPHPFRNFAYITESKSTNLLLEYTGGNVRDLYTNSVKAYVRGYDPGSSSYTNEEKFNWDVYGSNTLNNVLFPKTLRFKHGIQSSITPNLSTNPKLTVNTAFIGNDMIIGLNNTNESNFGLFDNVLQLDALGLLSTIEKFTNFDTPVELNGTYYINGNLYINSARLTGNATFFVGGKTVIDFSDIGVDAENVENKSNLNIISKGDVRFAYVGNNHYNDENLKIPAKFINDVHASNWNGHIHSDGKITIDGATSNIIINGSMSAKEIEITSIKGRTQSSCRTLGYYIDNHLVDGLLGGILGLLLPEALVNSLFNLLLGSDHSGNSYNLVLNKDGSKFTSNCFEKVAGQNLKEVSTPTFLLKALNIQLVGTGKEIQAITPRVQINYAPGPIDYLKQSFNVQYETTPRITELDPPKLLSRE